MVQVVFYGSMLVFHGSRSVFMVFHGSRSISWFFMIPGRFAWFCGSRLVFHGRFLWFFYGSRLVFHFHPKTVIWPHNPVEALPAEGLLWPSIDQFSS